MADPLQQIAQSSQEAQADIRQQGTEQRAQIEEQERKVEEERKEQEAKLRRQRSKVSSAQRKARKATEEQAKILRRQADLPSVSKGRLTQVSKAVKEAGKEIESQAAEPKKAIRKAKKEVEQWYGESKETIEKAKTELQKQIDEGITKVKEWEVEQTEKFKAENIYIEPRKYGIGIPQGSETAAPIQPSVPIGTEIVPGKHKNTYMLETEGGWVSKSWYNSLSPDLQNELKRRGIDNFNWYLQDPTNASMKNPWEYKLMAEQPSEITPGMMPTRADLGLTGTGTPSPVMSERTQQFLNEIATAALSKIQTPSIYSMEKAETAAIKKQQEDMKAALKAFKETHEKHGSMWWAKGDWATLPESGKIAALKGIDSYNMWMEDVRTQIAAANSLVTRGDISVEQFYDRVKDYVSPQSISQIKSDSAKNVTTINGEQYVRAGSDGWVKSTEFAKLPQAQQTVLNKQGFKGLQNFIEQNETALDPYKYYSYNKKTGQYEKVTDLQIALLAGMQDSINALYTDKEIEEILAGRITEKKPGTVLGTLQLISEVAGSPWLAQHPEFLIGKAEAQTGVKTKSEEKRLADYPVDATMTIAGQRLGQILPGDSKAKQEIQDLVDYHKSFMNDWTEFTDAELIPMTSELSESLHEWMTTGKKGTQTAKAIPTALADAGLFIPSIITLSFASSIQHGTKAMTTKEKAEAEKELQIGTAGYLVPALGGVSWFVGRPPAIASDPAVEGVYTAALLFAPSKVKSLAKNAAVKWLPMPVKGLTPEALGINSADIARVRTPAGVSPAEARAILEVMERELSNQIPPEAIRGIRGATYDQVNVKVRDNSGVGRTVSSGFQRAIPEVILNASPDMYTEMIKQIGEKGYFETGGEMKVPHWFSPQEAGSFLLPKEATTKVDPVIYALMYRAKDLRGLPKDLVEMLREGDVQKVKEEIFRRAAQGKLEEGIYPVFKWYGPKQTLEYELISTPGFKSYPVKPTWYAKAKDVNTAVSYTTSPVSGKVGGLKVEAGQKVPIVWMATKSALAEGAKMPSLSALYAAELYSIITEARKKLPWNIQFRKVTFSPSAPAAGSFIGSKLKAFDIKGPAWAKDINAIIQRVKDGRLKPYWRDRGTAIVVDENGKMLIVKERNGQWSLPGGKIESGASSIGTILRELKEETGVSAYRYKDVGIYRDTKPMISDYGEVLWHNGQPVYNKHHVYLVKVSRSAKPKASKEVKGVSKVQWENVRDLPAMRKEASFVKPILKTVSLREMANFLLDKKSKPVSKVKAMKEVTEPTKTLTKDEAIERLNRGEFVDERTQLPYRIEIKPNIYVTLRGEYIDTRGRPEKNIYPNYEVSRTTGRIEIKGEEPVTPERATTETVSEILTERIEPARTVPEEKASEAQRAERSATIEGIRPTATERRITAMRAEPKPVPERPRPEPVPELPVPHVPPPPPPVTLGGIAGFNQLTKEQKLASVAWQQGRLKQGPVYHLIYPPYCETCVLHSFKPFPGVKTEGGPKSAYESITRIHGAVLPEKILWDLGIMDITMETNKEGKVTMKYVPDVKQRTFARKPIGYPEVKTVRRAKRTNRRSMPSLGGMR